MSDQPRKEIVWFLPGAKHLELRFRQPTNADVPPAPMEIPTSGPFALPSPQSSIPWFPKLEWVRVETLDPALQSCPHCGTHATRFRATGDAYICSLCGRSFTRAAFNPLPREPESESTLAPLHPIR
jgi:ribosomal protein L37AE/L43A